MRHRVSTIMQGGFYGICAALVAAYFVYMTSQPRVIETAAEQRSAVTTQ